MTQAGPRGRTSGYGKPPPQFSFVAAGRDWPTIERSGFVRHLRVYRCSPLAAIDTWRRRLHRLKTLSRLSAKKKKFLWRLTPAVLLVATAMPVLAASPWENAVSVLQQAFTSTIARGLSLVAIVVGGLMFAFGEGDSKRMLAGIVFGVGNGDWRRELHGVALSIDSPAVASPGDTDAHQSCLP